MAPEVGLAASARTWPDVLRRYALDHGGARVAATYMGGDQVVLSEIDVLLIDDVCSFLSPKLVADLRCRGIGVVGVYETRDAADAKRHLLDCGVTDVIEADATPKEFLTVINSVVGLKPNTTSAPPAQDHGLVVPVTGTTHGVGATEVAIALADHVSSSAATTLVDLDPVAPSISQRLDLPIYPNVRTAVDLALRQKADIHSAAVTLGRMAVVVGALDSGQFGLNPVEAKTATESLAASCEVLICDTGPISSRTSRLGDRSDGVVLVGTGDPVGLTRLLKALRSWPPQAHPPAVVVNRIPKHGPQGREIEARIKKASEGPVVLLPEDRSVSTAVWSGLVVARGRFRSGLARLARSIVEMA